MTDYIYDIETFPNVFSIGLLNSVTEQYTVFECSWRRNELFELVSFLDAMRENNDRMVGYNNIFFDYPVLHHIIENRSTATPGSIYQKAMEIITSPWERRFDHVVWDSDPYVTQADLAEVAETTAVTIRTHHNTLMERYC